MIKLKYLYILSFLVLSLFPKFEEYMDKQDTHYEIRRFGYATWFGRTTMPAMGNSDFTVTRHHYSFISTYEIRHNNVLSDFIDISYHREDFKISNQEFMHMNIFNFGFDKRYKVDFMENRYIVPLLRGGFRFQAMKSGDVENVVFTDILDPIYSYVTDQSAPISFTSRPAIRGVGFGLVFDIGFRITAGKYLRLDTYGKTAGSMQIQYFKDSNIEVYPLFFLTAGFSEKISLEFELWQPWFKYEGSFGWERNLLKTYKNYFPDNSYKQLFIIGVDFKFSLFCFG